MDRKPLVGVSLCAVVLFVLGSLSNVVGYQSVKSTVNDSPLFQTRTQRATNQQQNIVTSLYLGKDKSHNLLILPRLDVIGSSRDVISKIQTMNDVSFQRFVSIAVHQLSKEEKLKDVTPQQLITGLNQIRCIPHTFMDYSIFNNGNITVQPSPTACWFPGCLILYILILIVLYITTGPNTTRYCIQN
ncbi:MAG: hypothetical protein JW840_07220 [Candidatus Thermoplasmatota archaeon]|nr:hypothetical protein [Candidatus Thermoplasmatota archaeon]